MTVADGEMGPRRGDGLDALPRRLDAALRRERADRFLATFTIAAAAAFVAFGLLEFATVSFRLPLDLADRCALALILGLALVFVGMAADVVARPGRLGIARRADTRLELGERLSTAVEVAAAGHKGAPVARALLQDAERRAAAIDPRTLVAVPYGRYALALVAAVAFAAMSLAPPDPAPPAAGDAFAASPATLTEAETIDTAEELRRVTTILEADAAERNDPFLAALAREAGRIRDEVETGRMTDRDAIVAALDRLAGLTAEAYPPVFLPAEEFETPTAAMPAEVTQMLRNLARERMTPPSATPEGTRSQEQPLVEPANDTPADIPPMMGLPAPTEDVANPQTPDADGAEPTGGARAPGDEEGYIQAADMETFNDPTNYRVGTTAGDRPEDAAPIGPADNANAGQSRFAGAGQPALEGAPAAEVDPFAIGDDMLLTGQLDQTGRRIRIEMPPDIQAITIAPGDVTAMDWAPRREVEVLRTGVPLAARDLLARYFRAAAEAE